MNTILINPFDAPGHKSVSRNVLVPSYINTDQLKRKACPKKRERCRYLISKIKQKHFRGR